LFLYISRYVSTAQNEIPLDLNAVNLSLQKLEKEITHHTVLHNQFLKELGLPGLSIDSQNED